MAKGQQSDRVIVVPNDGWDSRLLICRCAPTVDSFVLVTTRFVVVIDTLLNPATAMALIEIIQPYLRDGRTPLVINTHADWDHCWGNQLFAGPHAVLPAPIIGHARSVPRFGAEMFEQLRTNQDMYPGRFDTVEPIAPTLTFSERLTIDGGDLTLELFLAAGHTDDHIALYIPEIATLLAGDAAEEPFPFAYTVAGLVALRATLHRLRALGAAEAFYCHAAPQSGLALLDRNSAYFDELESRCRTALEAKAPLEEEVWPFVELEADSDAPGDNLAMYRDGHARHIALMFAWLKMDQSTH
jgi:glyoxylase-like metal-dependent hydrolase (beta-lactamase superfamily II)